jgi:hypothetical protein
MVHEPTRAALNASQYGTGKTVVTIEVAEGISANIKLIVAPLFTKYSWEKTILEQYPNATVSHINSRKAGQNALNALLDGVTGWYIIGREYFASKSVHGRIAKASPRIDFMAYDECAKWANRKSQGFRIMKTMKPGYRMALSATPAANKFSGMYAITKWLWPHIVPNSFWNWVDEWCETEMDFFAGKVIVGELDPGKYVSQLPCYVRLEKDFGEPYEEVIEIDLSVKERRIYEDFEKSLIVWLNDHPLIATVPIVKRIRLRQMTLGEVSINPETDEVFFDKDMKSSKYNTLVSYIGEHPNEPMVIFTDSAKYANVVAYKLIEDGHKALPWTGEVPEDVRHELKEAFLDGRIDFLVATVASIGEGVDGLQHRARTMVWLSKSDNNMLNMQAFRRLYRRGQERQVISVDIAARDTYDLGQLSSLVQQALRMNASLKKGG